MIEGDDEIRVRRARLRAVADQLLAVCRGHEEADHPGDPAGCCIDYRAMSVAVLAHAVGLRAGDNMPGLTCFSLHLSRLTLAGGIPEDGDDADDPSG